MLLVTLILSRIQRMTSNGAVYGQESGLIAITCVSKTDDVFWAIADDVRAGLAFAFHRAV